MADSRNRSLMTLSTLGILIVVLFNAPSQNTNVAPDRPARFVAEENTPAGQPVANELKTALRKIVREELAALPATPMLRDAKNTPSSRQDAVISAAPTDVRPRTDAQALPYNTGTAEQECLTLMNQLYDAGIRRETNIRNFPAL